MRRVDMCAVLYCSPDQLSATFVAGRNDHRSDIACATRLRKGVFTKAPEHTVNIARGKRTGFETDPPEGRHRARTDDDKSCFISADAPRVRALCGYIAGKCF